MNDTSSKDGRDDGMWFAAKRIGFGAGLPIAWEGWVVYAAYIAGMIGLSRLGHHSGSGTRAAEILGFVLLTMLMMLIVQAKTRGGWKWRSGGEE